MDPEVLVELQNSISQLSSLVSSQATALGQLNTALSNSSTITQQNTNAQREGTTANQRVSNGSSALGNAQKKASDIIAESSNNLRNALGAGATAVKSFTDALLSNQEGFSKYGSSAGKLGEASWELGKNFGIVGKVLGLLGLAMGKIVEIGTKQADAQLKAVDTISGIGGAGKFTTNEMMRMGHKMGLNSFNLEKFTKAADSARGSMVAFNGNAGDGIAEFGKLAAVTAKQRQAFQRLGVSQEELMQRQADYLTLQTKSGIAIDKRSMADGSLQKLSLEYAQSLAVISKITGRNAQEAKEGQERAMAAVNMQIHTRQLNQQLEQAKANGNKEEVERIQKQLIIERDLVNAAEQTGDAAQLAAVQSKLATGSYTKTSASLLRTGIDLDKIQQEQQKRSLSELQKDAAGTGEAAAAYKGALREGVNKNIKNLGNSLATGDELAAQYGVTLGTMKFTAENANTDFKKAYRKANDEIGKPSEGKGPPKTEGDPAQVARNNLTQFEIEAGIKFDNFVASMNPLLGNTGPLKMLATAAGALAAVFGVALVAGGLKKLFTRKPTLVSLDKRITALEKGEVAPGGSPQQSMMQKAKSTVLGRGAATGKAAKGAAATGVLAKAKSVGGKLPDLANNKTTSTLKQMSTTAGSTGGSFLEGVVRALILTGRNAITVVEGSTALSVAIIELSAALGVSAVILGLTLPALASGLAKFNKLNGPNLKAVGIGMAGLGAGILAMGAGKVAGAIGNVVNWFVKGEDPLENSAKQIKKLEAMTLNTPKIKMNSEAVVAFSKAMAAASGMGALGSAANMAKGIAESINSFFGGKPVTDQLVEFSKLDIDNKNVAKNAAAFKVFAEAMATYQGYGSSAGAAGAAVSEAITGFFKSTPPYEQMVKFGELVVDSKGVQKNSKAFKAFAEAMASFKGYGSGLGAIGQAIAESATKFFHAQPPLSQFVTFSWLPINPTKTKQNAIAFKLFSEAMASYKGMGVLGGLGAISTAMADAAFKFFQVKPPLEQFVYFSRLNIDPKKTKGNAEAFVSFANAMATYKGGPGLIDTVSSLLGKGFGAIFGEDGPVEAFRKFAKEDFGPNATQNSENFRKYAESMGALGAPGTSPPGSTNIGSAPSSPSFSDTVSSAATTGAQVGAGIVGAVTGATGAAASKVYDVGSAVWKSITGQGKGREAGVKPDVLGRKEALEKIMGSKLVVTSGYRAGAANHGSGAAIDLGFNSNPILKNDDNRNKLMANAINMGFTGIGAEYRAPGGAHIHLDTSHRSLTGWGSDYTGKTLSKDSPWLANYINKVRSGEVKLKASEGGIFGYTGEQSMSMPGNSGKKLAPLQLDSILMKLAKAPMEEVQQMQKDMMKAVSGSSNGEKTSNTDAVSLELYHVVSQKLDSVLTALESSRGTQHKMLKRSLA